MAPGLIVTGTPKVSVIVPCYNIGQFLDEAIESVLSQSYQDFEILIVDDGSTDPTTLRVLEGYARPKTTLFRTQNQGLARARNFLIARARGEYLCALDADDKLYPEFLEKTVHVLNSEPSVTFVSTHLQMFGLEEQIWPPDPRCDLSTLLAEDTVITAALVRRAAVLDVGGYDERMPHQGDEDWDLWISLAEAGYRGVILPDVLFLYRRREHSMSAACSTGAVHIDLMRYLIRKHSDSYRVHLPEVLLWNEREISDLRRANMQLEEEIASSLRPTIERRRTEVQLLRDRLFTNQRHRQLEEEATRREAATVAAGSWDEATARHFQERAALDAEYKRSLDEVAALRTSLSWRVTAPFRAPLDLLRGLRRRFGRD
jgi:glycosyltransferase involved in cell wall biosynthesis